MDFHPYLQGKWLHCLFPVNRHQKGVCGDPLARSNTSYAQDYIKSSRNQGSRSYSPFAFSIIVNGLLMRHKAEASQLQEEIHQQKGDLDLSPFSCNISSFILFILIVINCSRFNINEKKQIFG